MENENWVFSEEQESVARDALTLILHRMPTLPEIRCLLHSFEHNDYTLISWDQID